MKAHTIFTAETKLSDMRLYRHRRLRLLVPINWRLQATYRAQNGRLAAGNNYAGRTPRLQPVPLT